MQDDVLNAALNSQIIEEYQNDYLYPSCLVMGSNLKNKSIHVVVSTNGKEVWIITSYYPNNSEWEEDLKTRKEIK